MIPKKIIILMLLATIVILFISKMTSYKSPNEQPVTTPKQEKIVTRLIVRYAPLEANRSDNFPDLYLDEKSKRPKGFNKTCAKFPNLLDLQFRNDYWQKQRTSNGTFYLFNAYLDERNSTSPKIRIVGLFDVKKPTTKYYCQFWYPDKDEPAVAQTEILLWLFRPRWGADSGYFFHPYLITCPLPDKVVPVSVSLVEDPCDKATNNLKVSYKKVDEKKNFVVCVKGLFFPDEGDRTVRLTEWTELLSILGAEKVHFYEFSIHPNIRKLLDFYKEQDKVELTPLTLVDDVPNLPFHQKQFLGKKTIQRRLEEVITYNDCLYRHLDEYKYVVLLDTDEVIVPLNGTWIELIEQLQKIYPNTTTSYVARNVYFLDSYQHQHEWFEDIPQYMHMLQHVSRARNFTKPGFFIKGFHDTRKVLGLHNHFPIGCLGGCITKEMDVTVGRLQHYRADCAAGVSNCQLMKQNSVKDFRLHDFKNELVERVGSILEELEFSDF